MLIRQNQILGEATAFLDTLYRVSLEENGYPAKMVNIRHNQRLGRDLIQLESFLKFGQMNGITDGGYAIHVVCEANGVPSTNIAFAVNEENLFLDVSLLETYCQLKNSNFGVYVQPISDYSLFRTHLNEALLFDDAYPDYESSIYLQQYVNESILDSAKATATKGIGQAKGAVSNGTKEIASKLASIRKEIAIKSSKAAATTGTAKVKLMQQVNKLKSAAKELSSQLSGAKNSMIHRAEKASKSVRSAVHTAQKNARAKARMATGAVDNVTKALGKHVDSAKDAIGNVSNAVGKHVSGAKDAVSNAMGNASNAISKHANSAKDAVAGAANNIKSKLD